jgi:hypothetical protein
MIRAELNAQLVTEVLNRLEGHPNFVKANRIIDVLHQSSRESASKKITSGKLPSGITRLHLAEKSA